MFFCCQASRGLLQILISRLYTFGTANIRIKCHLAITVISNNSKYLHTCLADVTCNYYPRSVHTCLADIDSQFFPCNLRCIHQGQLQGSLLWHEWQALNDAFYFSVLAITYNDVLSQQQIEQYWSSFISRFVRVFTEE